MTNLTNDQITDIWEAMPSGAQGWLKEFGYIQFARGIEDAVAAKFAPQQQPEPIGVVSPMPGASGFTMACFAAEDAPAGTKLYLAATTQASTAQAEPDAWISVDERLPVNGEAVLVMADSWDRPAVLVYGDQPYQRFVDRRAGLWFWYPERMHWMPLPAAPVVLRSAGDTGGVR